MKYSALIFDFDGTIADTLAEAADIYNILAEQHGYKTVSPQDIPALRHCSLKTLTKELGVSKIRLPFLLNKGRKLLKERVDSLSPIEGMIETIKEIRPLVDNCGILTSNSTENVELFLENNGIRDLFTFISSTTKLSGKAKHINSICRTFSINKKDVLYIGDEIRDVKASHKSGISIAAVSWGFNSRDSLEQSSPTYLIDEPTELFDLVRK